MSDVMMFNETDPSTRPAPPAMKPATAAERPLRISFVLPGPSRSGGVRVAVVMANELLRRGHEVRLLHPAQPLVNRGRRLARRLRGVRHDDWLPQFRGPVAEYTDLSETPFASGEIVVAVGAWVIDDVYGLDDEVVKVRWCHGFSDHLPRLMKYAWSLPMHTISVSERLVERLEGLTPQPIAAVVPNGVDAEQYYDMKLKRTGVGALYSTNLKKAPAVLLDALVRIKEQEPQIQRHVFGVSSRPPVLGPREYVRCPSIKRARQLYGSSAVWIIPSNSEGFCLPILEAMACGAAVVSTDHDTARGLIDDGVNGILTPVGDAGALADAALQVWRDEDRRRALVDAGFETATRFSWRRAAQLMDACLRGLRPGPTAQTEQPAIQRDFASETG